MTYQMRHRPKVRLGPLHDRGHARRAGHPLPAPLLIDDADGRLDHFAGYRIPPA